jgi:F0F1-type ATP synthase assembly protein I
LSGKLIDNQRKILNGYKKVGPYLGLGTQLAATVILMFYLGYWLDQKFSTYPILIIIFSFLGGVAAIYNFIKSVLKLTSKDKKG